MEFSKLFETYTVGTSGGAKGKKLDQTHVFKSYEEAVAFTQQNKKYDIIAGRVAKGYILIDCDSEESVVAMDAILKHQRLKPFILKTNRGKHYYFRCKNCSKLKAPSGVVNGFGIEYDLKPGNGKINCGIIYQNHQQREILSDVNNPSYAPVTLTTTLKVGKGSVQPAYKINARNDTLYTQYRPAYIKSGYTQEEAVNCVLIMQDAGILKHQGKGLLEKEEIENIFRDPWKLEGGVKGKKSKTPNQIAEEILEEERIIKIGDNAFNFYLYTEGYYKPCQPRHIRELIYNRNRYASRKYRDDILDCICLDNRISYETPALNYICFNNGILHIPTLEFKPHTPDIVCTTKVPHDYKTFEQLQGEGLDQEKYDVLWNSLLLWANYDMELVTLLLEIGGCCLSNDVSMQKCFFLSGEKQNGKSAFVEFLQYCIGEDNYTAIDAGELSARFMTIEVKDKLANVADDIADANLSAKTVSMLKKLVTGNPITAERKNQDPITFKNFATMVFSCNDAPRSLDVTGALKRRVLHVPFDHKFEGEEKDGDILSKLCNEYNATVFLALATEAFKKAKERGEYTICEKVKLATERIMMETDAVFAWMSELARDNDTDIATCFMDQPVETHWSSYTEWAKDNHFGEGLGKTKWMKKVCTHLVCKVERRQIQGVKCSRWTGI